MIKVLPNLTEGIQIVGFLKDIDENTIKLQTGEDIEVRMHYIIYNANTYVIMGVTTNCFSEFGIPASLVYGNSSNTTEFTLDAIAPEIINPTNFD